MWHRIHDLLEDIRDSLQNNRNISPFVFILFRDPHLDIYSYGFFLRNKNGLIVTRRGCSSIKMMVTAQTAAMEKLFAYRPSHGEPTNPDGWVERFSTGGQGDSIIAVCGAETLNLAKELSDEISDHLFRNQIIY